MTDLAVIVADAIRKELTKVDEVYVDFPQNIKWREQTTVVVVERDSVLNDDHADAALFGRSTGNDYPGIYTTTLEINVMAKDRKTAKVLCLDAARIGWHALNQLVDIKNGPIWAVWYGTKSCGPASLGGVYLQCTGAKREIVVSNSIEP